MIESMLLIWLFYDDFYFISFNYSAIFLPIYSFCSRRKIWTKIHKQPHRQACGRVVNVPTNIMSTIKSIPREFKNTFFTFTNVCCFVFSFSLSIVVLRVYLFRCETYVLLLPSLNFAKNVHCLLLFLSQHTRLDIAIMMIVSVPLVPSLSPAHSQ